MTTVVRKETTNEKSLLQPVRVGGWLGGFGNLLRKELGQWFGTRTWWSLTLIWVLMFNGVSTIIMFHYRGTPEEALRQVMQTFLPMSAVVISLGTVIATQGAIVGEKELGTAAWVMSKPASRHAFVLAKVVGYVTEFWLTAIVIPASIFFITFSLLVDAPLALTPFLAGVGVVALCQLFYLTLSLMLGTLFGTRGPVAAIGIGIFLAGLLLKGLLPLPILMVTPWALPDLSTALALQMNLPVSLMIPVAAIAGWSVLFLTVALWRFNREEF